jgi:hypothetical protein
MSGLRGCVCWSAGWGFIVRVTIPIEVCGWYVRQRVDAINYRRGKRCQSKAIAWKNLIGTKKEDLDTSFRIEISPDDDAVLGATAMVRLFGRSPRGFSLNISTELSAKMNRRVEFNASKEFSWRTTPCSFGRDEVATVSCIKEEGFPTWWRKSVRKGEEN